MSLIHLYDPIRTEDDLALFANYNFIDHQFIVDGLFAQRQIAMQLLDIRIILRDRVSYWALNHQNMHNSTNQAFGLAGTDFTHIDFADPKQVDVMRQLHAEEHRQWHFSLGI